MAGGRVGLAVFAGITVGGIDVAGIEVAAGAATVAGAQALKAKASNNTNIVVFIVILLADEELTR